MEPKDFHHLGKAFKDKLVKFSLVRWFQIEVRFSPTVGLATDEKKHSLMSIELRQAFSSPRAPSVITPKTFKYFRLRHSVSSR